MVSAKYSYLVATSYYLLLHRLVHALSANGLLQAVVWLVFYMPKTLNPARILKYPKDLIHVPSHIEAHSVTPDGCTSQVGTPSWV